MSDRLSEQHRLAQVRLGAITATAILQVWPLLDPEQLDATFERWLTAVTPIVGANRAVSIRLATNYLAAHRTNALGIRTPATATLPAGPVDPARLRTSMLVTGPVSIRRAMSRGINIASAADTAAANTARAALRHVLDGGRETILETVRADPRATGYERTTSGSACAFCSDLAGITSADADAISFEAHDGCSCSAAPVYA